MQLKTLLDHATQQLNQTSPSASLDAELLLAHAMHVERAYLYTWPQKVIPAQTCQQFQTLLQQRLQGKPMAYILGQQEFWSMSLDITEDVLIPRPETELLVTSVLEKLHGITHAKIADLGTGSGAIALALAKERPAWTIYATDAHPAALAVAKRNRAKLGLTNLQFCLGDWCEALSDKGWPRKDLHAIVSNPPYIAPNDPHLNQGDLQFEPHYALVSEQQGYAAIALIITQAASYLRPKGWLLLEHGYQQDSKIRQLLSQHGFQAIETLTDLALHPRVTVAHV